MLHLELLKTYKRKGEWVFPDYKKYCLSSVPWTVANIFGQKTNRPTIPLKYKSDKVIFFLFDGFGFNQWKNFRHPVKTAFEEAGDVFPITTVYPSSTAAAMTTLHTGLTPQEHGLLEWYVYFREIDMILMTLPFASEFEPQRFKKIKADPKILLDSETFYQKLKRNGINVYMFKPEGITKGAYSDLAFKGANIIGYESVRDLFRKLRKQVIKKEKAYYFVYCPDIDTSSHVTGPFSRMTRRRKKYIFNKLRSFFVDVNKKIGKNTTVLISADHGQIKPERLRPVYLNGIDWFENSLEKSPAGRIIEPYGLPRDMFIQVKKEKLVEVKENIKKIGFDVIDINEFIKKGLFGLNKPSKRFIDRAGNLLVIPRKNGMVWYKHSKKENVRFRGIHGGLTEDEMIIPFSVGNLEKLSRKLNEGKRAYL